MIPSDWFSTLSTSQIVWDSCPQGELEKTELGSCPYSSCGWVMPLNVAPTTEYLSELKGPKHNYRGGGWPTAGKLEHIIIRT